MGRGSWWVGGWALAAFIAVLVNTVTAGDANAYVVIGKPWPGHVITYHNTFAADAEAVATAAADWNASGAHVRFKPAPAGRAEVTIGKMPRGFLTFHLPGGQRLSSDALGYATYGRAAPDSIGVTPSGRRYHGAHVWLLGVGSWHREEGIRVRMSEGEMTRVAVHELGHVLGLGHQPHGCVVMSPALGSGCTSARRPWIGLCPDPLEPDDIRGAVALYGGREPKAPVRRCSLFALPGPPRSLAVRRPTSSGGSTSLSWVDPKGISPPSAGSRYDPYSLSGAALVGRYRVRESRHGCPRRSGHVVAAGGARPGAAVRMHLDLTPGTWCLAVQIGDPFRRWGAVRTIRVTIAAPQYAPEASFVAPYQPLAGQAASFTDASTPRSAPIVTWRWSFGDGATASARNPTHVFQAAGTYPVTLTVTDANGKSSTTRQRVAVAAPTPPHAAFDVPFALTAGVDGTFNDDSFSGSSPIVAWAWSFGDGGASSDEFPDHTYAAAGTYTVTLTVTAQDGESSSTSETLTVDPPVPGG